MEAVNMKRVSSAWAIAGAQEFVGALRKTLNGPSDDNKHRHAMRGIRFGLRGSSAIIRIQAIIDRNVEMSARCNIDQAIDAWVNERPVKLVPVDHTPNGDKILCVVFHAVPTQFGRFCEKEVNSGDRRVVPHDFGLIEKHFGIHYDAVPGQRVKINASARVNA